MPKLPTDEELLANPPFGLSTWKNPKGAPRPPRPKDAPLFWRIADPEKKALAHEHLERLKKKHAERLVKQPILYPSLVACAANLALHGRNTVHRTRGRTTQRRYLQRRYLALRARAEGLDVPLPEWMGSKRKKPTATGKKELSLD